MNYNGYTTSPIYLSGEDKSNEKGEEESWLTDDRVDTGLSIVDSALSYFLGDDEEESSTAPVTETITVQETPASTPTWVYVVGALTALTVVGGMFYTLSRD